MASIIDICNVALDQLSEQAITSLNDGSRQANLCLRNYEVARDFALEKHNWNFAKARASLAADISAPSFEYAAQYTLPSDFIRLRSLYDDPEGQIDYEIEGNKLLCNLSAPLRILYTFRQTDTTRFSPGFVMLTAYYLGHLIAYPLTNSRSAQADMFQLFKDTLQDIKAIDSQQTPDEQIEYSRYIEVRR